MVIQTQYKDRHDPYTVGQIVDQQSDCNIVSRTVETAAGIGFGVPVIQGANDRGVSAMAADTTPFGITIKDATIDPGTSSDVTSQYDDCAVMTKGTVAVTVSGAFTARAAVYVTDAGAFTATSSDNNAFPGATFDTSGADGAIGVVRIA